MRNVLGKVIVLLLLCGALVAMSAGAATAGGLPKVRNHAKVGSVDLYGMTEAEARATIAREASTTLMPALRVSAAGSAFSIKPSSALVLDVEAMLSSAYERSSVPSFTVTRRYIVRANVVSAFTASVARSINRSSRNASYYIKNGKLAWRSALAGRSLYTSAANSAITRELLAEATSGAARPVLALSYKSYVPSVTNAKLGRAILVDLSARRLWLNDHSTLKATYRVAIGMRRYPTPRGVFKIIAKNPRPSWGNPGSDWASNMPSYIPPGPRNPLGLRALYLSAPGIRIHGTSKTSSIGTAASHGCIRVANSNIVKLYPLVPVGTKVFIIQ